MHSLPVPIFVMVYFCFCVFCLSFICDCQERLEKKTERRRVIFLPLPIHF